MGRDIPAGPTVSSRVELRLAGTFRVTRDGAVLTEGELGRRKSRTLLKLLAVERPGLVPVDRIIDVLWADNPPAGAEQNVASLVSRLRGALGSGVIVGGRVGYRLADSPHVSVDLDTATRYCDQAERKLAASPAIALATAEQALALLSAGVALADEPYSSWGDPARDELRALLRRARLAAAEAALAADDARTAVRYAEAATVADPLDEAAHRWYMSACAAAGEPAKALVAYAALREQLAEELGAQLIGLHARLLGNRQAALEQVDRADRVAVLQEGRLAITAANKIQLDAALDYGLRAVAGPAGAAAPPGTRRATLLRCSTRTRSPTRRGGCWRRNALASRSASCPCSTRT